MQIPVDFSHRVTVEELDTGRKAVFLIIRGTNERVRIPADQAEEIEEVLPPPADQLGSVTGIPVARTVDHQDPSEDIALGMSAPTGRLSPGKMSGPAKPQDAFGAHEG